MKYKFETWKLTVEGEYETEDQAIEDLSDRYMQCSKCDPPGEYIPDLLMGCESLRDISTIRKSVWFKVFETQYNIPQWITKYHLHIKPFKKDHWWEGSDSFDFTDCEFEYEVIPYE